MIKMYKKAVAIMLTLVFVLSLVPVVGMAETVPVKITNTETETKKLGGDIRGGTYSANNRSVAQPVSKSGVDTQARKAFFQYDISDYLQYLTSESTSFVFSIQHGGDNTARKTYSYDLYLLKGDHVDVSGETPTTKLSMDYAVEYGFVQKRKSGTTYYWDLITTSDDLIKVDSFESTSGDRNEKTYNVGAEDIKAAVKDTGWVTFILESTAGVDDSGNVLQTYFTRDSENTFLQINYDPSSVTDDSVLSGIAEEFTWEEISADSAASVTNATKLPNEFKGASVVWSDGGANVISDDGSIIQPRDSEKDVTLKATLTYGEASIEKEFPVTISMEELLTVTIPYSENTYISSATDERNIAKGVYGNNNDSYVRYMRNTGLYGMNGTSSDNVVFLKWNFSDYLNVLNAAQKISINLKNRDGKWQTNGELLFSVLPECYESWTTADLTYDSAVENGLYTAVPVYSEAVPDMQYEYEITSSAQMLDAIKKSVSDNPENGIVCFKWSAVTGSRTRYWVRSNDSSNFTITLSYYASDLKTNEELAESKLDSMPWSFVSQQAQDKVISDLTLPESFYGVPIEWASSDETVITSSGEVIVDAEEKTVTLTAKLGENTKDFVVTVPADVNYILDYTKADYVNAYVWAKETGSECTLVIATYEGNELVGVKAIEDFVPQKGKNFKWTDLSGKGDGKTVKIMLLENMTTLKPLAK